MVSKKSKKKLLFFTFLNWEKQTWYWEKGWLFSSGNRDEIWPLEKGRKSPVSRGSGVLCLAQVHNIVPPVKCKSFCDSSWALIIAEQSVFCLFLLF